VAAIATTTVSALSASTSSDVLGDHPRPLLSAERLRIPLTWTNCHERGPAET